MGNQTNTVPTAARVFVTDHFFSMSTCLRYEYCTIFTGKYYEKPWGRLWVGAMQPGQG
jgi:hypothetical protein